MNPAEVVKREVEREFCPMVLPLFAEAGCEPRESANRHSHREVLALNMRRTDSCGIGLPENWDYLRARHFSGRVSALTFGSRAVDLYQSREIHAIRQRVAEGSGATAILALFFG
jgi:hypothetical protein